MAVKPFTKEELNFFKFSSIVLDEFPKMLREIFIKMWDKKIATLPGYIAWDDSAIVRNLLLAREGGKTDIPTNTSINEWDCTALFKATIYSITFGRATSKSTKTLSRQYLKGKKPCPFHSSVISPSGNQDETVTLAIDQLRLLRNTLCHTPKPSLGLVEFVDLIQLIKDAFLACGVSIIRINEIGCLGEEDFPTEQVIDLNDRLKIELQHINMFLEHKIFDLIEEINDKLDTIDQEPKNGKYLRLLHMMKTMISSFFTFLLIHIV